MHDQLIRLSEWSPWGWLPQNAVGLINFRLDAGYGLIGESPRSY